MRVKKYLKHFSNKSIDLYGQEYFIAEKLLPILKDIKNNNYSYRYVDFGGDSFEGSCILHILNQLDIIEWGTSIRSGWIIDKGIFDILIIMLESNLDNISFKIEDNEDLCDDYDFNNKKHIEYIDNIINNSINN